MMNNARKWIQNNIVSPHGLAAISYAFFLFCCLIPPSIYSHYINEPDLLFLDPLTILYYTLCVTSFLWGVSFISWLFPASSKGNQFKARISPTTFLMLPLSFGILVAAASIILLIKYNPDILLLLLTQQGAELKSMTAQQISSSYNLAPLALTGIIWWVFWRSSDFMLSRWERRLVKISLIIAMFSVITASILFLSRDILMMMICGLAILFVIRRTAKKPIDLRFVLGAAAGGTLGIALFFFAFSFLRGVVDWDDQISILIGYTAASYNRLAAVVNGSLRYPFADRGLYLSSFVSFNHMWNRVVPLGALMNWPDQVEVWNAEFGAVTRAGLAGNLIWSGAFGYIFSDLGWFSLPFIFGCGMLYGVAWDWVKRGAVLGVILYPSFGYAALMWIGTNSLLDSERAVMLVTAIILACYESVLLKASGISMVISSS